MNHKKYYFFLFTSLCVNVFSQSKIKKDSLKNIDEVIISSKQMLGSKLNASNRTGSAYYVSPKELEKFGYTDINRILKSVPGVNIYEEDGYGLRPNISLRGTKAERSEKITIMEDGILASPAPYSAPAAYYFPNSARMYAIEVVKGSSQVQFGPFTTGGAINLVSTQIPSKLKAKLNASYGTNNTLKGHAMVGDQAKHFGYMIEYLRFQSDGFKHFENGNKPGFNRNDIVSKVMVKTDKSSGLNHALELKFGFANEDSKETYVGLSELDFRKNPYLRYNGTELDEMKTKHQQWALTYLMKSSGKFRITTNLYNNKFHRNWYKLNDVRAGITSQEKRTIGQVLSDPETNQQYFDILTGKTNYDGEALIVRANNRNYDSKGVQTKLNYDFDIKNIHWDLEAGIRYHEDSEDRFQWDDSYSMINGQMKLFLPGIQGTQNNRIASASAFSSFILNKLNYKNLTITAGLRYENIDLLSKNYTAKDLKRTGKIRIESENHADVIIPSFGINYQFTPSLAMFSGIHKGFSPPSAEAGQKYESSTNVELGIRFNNNRLTFEAIGFYNNFQNMLGSNLAAIGGTGELNQFDVGKAKVKGAEILLQYHFLPKSSKLQIPLQVSYTYTDTKMLNTFQEDSWGYVFSGDELPYINRNSLNANLSVSYGWFEGNVGMRYNGDMRTTPGQGIIAERELIPSYTIIDASVKAKINKHLSFTINGINLTNKKYLASRHPAGLRSGHPFGIFSGFDVRF